MSRIYVHPLPVRVWHWINAAGFLALLVTGLQLRYGVLFSLEFRTVVGLHNGIGFALTANYFVWLVFYLFSDRITVYHPDLDPARHYRDVMRQIAYYGHGMFKGEPNPSRISAHNKFNPLQRMTYQIVMMLLVPFQFYTGIVLWDLQRFSGTVEFLGGPRVVSTIHMALTIAFVVFLFVHVYLTTLGRTAGQHIRAMITGWEESEAAPAGPAAGANSAAPR